MNQNSELEKQESESLSRLKKLECEVARFKKSKRLQTMIILLLGTIGIISNIEGIKNAYAVIYSNMVMGPNTAGSQATDLTSSSTYTFKAVNSTGGKALQGMVTGGGFGVWGQGPNQGVYGQSDNTVGGGTDPTYAGVFGYSAKQAGVTGNSTESTGVYAKHTSSSINAPALSANNLGEGPAAFFKTSEGYGGGQIFIQMGDETDRTSTCLTGEIRLDGAGLLVCYQSVWRALMFLN